MTKTEGPWGGGENPWADPIVQPKKAKVKKFPSVEENTTVSGGGNGISPKWVILGALGLWLLSGFYQIDPNEQGVIMRFGKYVETTDPGLHYKIPFPVDVVMKVDVTRERSINLGQGGGAQKMMRFSHNVNDNGSNANYNAFTDSHILTGDENIVDVNLDVVWKVKNAKDYLFSMRDPDKTAEVAAQSVLREIIGQSEMQLIITGDRGKVEDETKVELQKLLDGFNSGVDIVRVKLQKADPPQQVVDAFNEVQRAKADMERFKNEADAYRNKVIPEARGRAARVLENAQAYRENVIKKAEGDAERFLSVYNAYKQGKAVTSKRLYLETMEAVLSNSDKVIIDPSAKGANPLPVLPLKNLK